MIVKFLAEVYKFASTSGIAPIIEFAIVGFIIMVTYMAMHAAFSKTKQGKKFVLSALVGLTGYTMAKMIIVAWVINPILADAINSNNPFLN